MSNRRHRRNSARVATQPPTVGRSAPFGVSEPPREATWPRLMTGRHPRAVGTYGPECIAWAEERPLQPKRSDGTRWWQRLALSRALEHDAAGALVWRTVIVSAPRQCGKSWLERMVCGWRIAQAERFGEEQALLHVAHKLVAAQEVWRPAARASLVDGARVRWANGEQKIELPDGSRWMIQAANDGAGVAFSLSMALVDEAWRIPRQVVDDALDPTMAESVSPQTWLVSTAGTAESDLMLTYRAAALAMLDVDDPGTTLLLEWSAPPDPDLDIDDPAVWRSFTPHWDDRREAAVRDARGKAGEHSFRQQWLNQWVPSVSRPLVGPATWHAVTTLAPPSDPLTFGIDVAPDRSWGAIVAYGAGVAELVACSAVAGRLEPAPGEGVAWLAPWLLSRAERFGGEWCVGVDETGPAGSVAAVLRTELGDRVQSLSGRLMAVASGQAYDRITSMPPALLMRPHPLLELAVTGARWRTYGQARTWQREDGGSPLIAATVAMWAAEHRAALELPAVW